MNNLALVERCFMSSFRMAMRLRSWLSGNAAVYLSENLPKEQVEQENNLRLRYLLEYAAGRFPFWNERMRACGLLNAAGLIDLDCFTALPTLERSELVERRDELSDENYPGETWWDQTGGSTGEPVRILKDRRSKEAMLKVKGQMYAWAGHHPGMSVVELWGAERDILDQHHRPPIWEWPLLQRLRCNKLVQNAFRMGEEQMRQYLTEWHWFRPRTVLAYAHSIHELALFAEREGIRPYKPKAIITSAGTLTDEMRADIRRAFGAPVFNRYGSREFGNMAMSCEREDGLHIIPTAVHIEIVRPDGSPTDPGELGEILVTSLTARAMPLIRYRIGDTGYWGESCPCDRMFPVIAQVTGKRSDNFHGQDGSLIHGAYFTHLVWQLEAIRKFQVVQENVGHVHFRLVLAPAKAFHQVGEEDRLTEETRKAMGQDCRVTFEYPEEIEPNATGKHRFTISRVQDQVSS
ncbi:phenylacetate--CoA ligase family protein [Halomonas sp. BC04]|uniref:phenylacetate--CoA ligase family protein n=1 Tax=Halomonas sp. BC04 TaxID=1403540 RepID=UPI0012DE3F56|nr:phenylacetate--CoA ligase family protein [Halomonas sp. BC04]